MPTTTPIRARRPCTGFWQAVSARLESLRALPAREVMEGLNELLEPFFPRLAAEVAGEPPEFKLVLTAHGSVDDFEDLMALVQSSPKLPQVEVEAFRQRSSDGFGMRVNDFEVASSEVLVKHELYRGRVALEIGFAKPIPMDMQDHARHMSLIMLDHILGEYDFAVEGRGGRLRRGRRARGFRWRAARRFRARVRRLLARRTRPHRCVSPGWTRLVGHERDAHGRGRPRDRGDRHAQ